MGSVVAVHKLSCSEACGIFLDQGSSLCPLHCHEGLRIRTSIYGLVWVGEIQFIPQHIQLVLNKVVACLLFVFERVVSVQGINIYLITIW